MRDIRTNIVGRVESFFIIVKNKYTFDKFLLF